MGTILLRQSIGKRNSQRYFDMIRQLTYRSFFLGWSRKRTTMMTTNCKLEISVCCETNSCGNYLWHLTHGKFMSLGSGNYPCWPSWPIRHRVLLCTPIDGHGSFWHLTYCWLPWPRSLRRTNRIVSYTHLCTTQQTVAAPSLPIPTPGSPYLKWEHSYVLRMS